MKGMLTRLRKEARGLACLRALEERPRAAAQMTPEGRLWCSQSGLAERVGSLWRITDKGRELLRRQSEAPRRKGVA